MAFLAVDMDGSEYIYDFEAPYREDGDDYWHPSYDKHGETYSFIELPKGSIRKLIGRELTWEDEPVEIKGE